MPATEPQTPRKFHPLVSDGKGGGAFGSAITVLLEFVYAGESFVVHRFGGDFAGNHRGFTVSHEASGFCATSEALAKTPQEAYTAALVFMSKKGLPTMREALARAVKLRESVVASARPKFAVGDEVCAWVEGRPAATATVKRRTKRAPFRYEIEIEGCEPPIHRVDEADLTAKPPPEPKRKPTPYPPNDEIPF